ncbi:MAG: DUF4230 domain-containing protein [Chloroflexi bacterium]|nr:DUF4230 domain-containing protein [Chloroflexota bacterium]MBP7042426.1 DUF4230 domain-containing protein [Chloroflexota bacterium]
MTKQENVNVREGSSVGVILRNIVFVVLIVFMVMGSVAAYAVIAGANKVDQNVVQPVSDLVRSLIIPATPVYVPSPTTIVTQINDLSRLETASIELEKVVTAERNQDALWGLLGESLVFVAHGKVVAGVDFAEMSVEDIQVYGPDTVMVHLPAVKIFDDLPALDTGQSYVASRDSGLLSSPDADMETEVRRLAEQKIREAAQESGLLDLARNNAENYMRDFLMSLGFTNVTFTETTPPPPPAPYTQEVPKGYILVTATPEAP